MAERSPSARTAIYVTQKYSRRLIATPWLKTRDPTYPRCCIEFCVSTDDRKPATNCASALLFFQWRIGFIHRRLRFGALGFAQRCFLVSPSFFLLAPSTCRPRSLGSISSVIWLKCHHVPRWLIRTYLKITGCCRSAIKVE